VNRSLPSQTFRSTDSDRSGRSDVNRSTQGSRSGQSDARQYEARRPTDDKSRATDDKVRDFLGMRGGDNDRRDRDRDRNTNLTDRDRDRTFTDRDRNTDDRGRTFTDRDRNVGDRDRNVGDRDRNINRWSNTWHGDKGDRRDDRDWSGRWSKGDRFSVADRIRHDWDGRRDNDRIFHSDWWRSRHRGNYWGFWGDYAYRYNRPWYWWSWVTGPRLASWVVFGWPTPYYWDYGPGEYIYYDNGGIYVNGRWYEPAPVYYDQTVQLIEQAPDLTPEAAASLEWLPLGVFAVTPDGVADPDVIVQLAVTKDGVVGGTAFDQKSGAAYNIRGIVDKRTQRAVWSYRDDRDKRLVMETSIYNLTQSEATGMVHYGPNDMRVIELVRLEQPDAGSTATLPTPTSR